VIVEEIFEFTSWDFEQLQGFDVKRVPFDVAKAGDVHEFSDVFVKQKANVLGVIYAIIEEME